MFYPSKRASSRRTRLGLESLNSRIVPAVILSTADLDGDGAADDLRIVGDGQSSKIAMVDNGSNQVQIQIDANGDGDYTDTTLGDVNTFHNFTGDSLVLDVEMKGGNDSLIYLSIAAMNDSSRSVSVDMGSGNDTFFWTQNNLISAGSHISLDVVGGGGADKATVDFNAVSQSFVSVAVDLGASSDTYDLTFGEVDQFSSVDVKTNLGGGLNVHSIDIDAVGKNDQATMDVTVVGGSQTDTVNLRIRDDVGDGQVSSHLNVYVDLLGGNDVFLGKMDGGDFRVDNNSDASFVVRGGLGNDQLKFERTGSGFIRLDQNSVLLIDLDGGAGKDVVSVDFSGVDAFQLDAASFAKIRLDGGIGNDVLSCLLTNDSATTGNFDVAVRGGAGDDTMTFAMNNNGGTPLYGPAGAIVLDGGKGKDTLANGNPAITLGTTFETVI